jgi:hypothetical protein
MAVNGIPGLKFRFQFLEKNFTVQIIVLQVYRSLMNKYCFGRKIHFLETMLFSQITETIVQKSVDLVPA